MHLNLIEKDGVDTSFPAWFTLQGGCIRCHLQQQDLGKLTHREGVYYNCPRKKQHQPTAHWKITSVNDSYSNEGPDGCCRLPNLHEVPFVWPQRCTDTQMIGWVQVSRPHESIHAIETRFLFDEIILVHQGLRILGCILNWECHNNVDVILWCLCAESPNADKNTILTAQKSVLGLDCRLFLFLSIIHNDWTVNKLALTSCCIRIGISCKPTASFPISPL